MSLIIPSYKSFSSSISGVGGISAAAAAFYINPSSTTLGTNTYFTYLSAPTTTGSGTTASTLYIAGAPSGGTITNSYALNIASGKTVLSDTTESTSSTTGALQCAGGAYFGANSLFGGKCTFTTTNGIPGGEAIRVSSMTSPYQTKLYSVNTTYDTSLYFPEHNGIDRLVSRASVDTLLNKNLTSSTNTFPSRLLGLHTRTSNFTSTTAGWTDVTGVTTTVTVPTGGATIKITVYVSSMYSGSAQYMYLGIYEGGTQLQSLQRNITGGTWVPAFGGTMTYIGTATAGSHTYNLKINTGGGMTAEIEAGATYPLIFAVETI